MTSRTTPEKKPPGWKVEGVPPAEGEKSQPLNPLRRPTNRRVLILALVLLAANWFLTSLLFTPTRLELSYTEFLDAVETEKVETVFSQGDSIQGRFLNAQPVPDDPEQTAELFSTVRPSWADDSLVEMLRANNVEISAVDPEQRPIWQQLLFGFGPTILLIWIFVAMWRRAGSALGGIGGLGRSRAKRFEATTQRTTFDDVAGIDDAKAELTEIVDFLKNPGKYTRLGGAIPKGVLLSGPPGTGKTLLARAVAGEANVPFFSMSASEFIEMVVGVGASRVRDLFEEAKKVAPAIIFIDELDAIGRTRGGGVSLGGHDEREQTLNQILTEMDGFTGSEGVIVIAATNRPEVLDSALIRPGRFDRQVAVSPPDQRGRLYILQIHTRNVPLNADADLASIASSTPGMVGADLRNLVNEAALMAARRNHEDVTMADFADALEKIVLGTERQIMMSDTEKERTAFHEAGHALLGMLLPGADPVRKISIIPRGRALGVTFQSPDADRYAYDRGYLEGRIVGALGGRAAEDVVFGTITTGAENDLVQVTRIARSMVGKWGMSDAIGPITVIDENREAFMRPEVGEKTQEIMDDEVRRIVDECYQRAVTVLKEHRSQLDALAAALLDKETLDEAEAYQVAGIPRKEVVDVKLSS
ncbi:MAG: ATP-dependent metallopeptidase FtsH/Yme1/Tma family protein [Acidimicrobiia bacterium]|nr:ATP-dependent metallopeptidase FtsH/Yme1/Tma family protein [Acidimicrobiia bacterium]MDQ3500449.1 ATP-dependent zinc metalloprotease FtsH [Actinomycetota bacterium]